MTTISLCAQSIQVTTYLCVLWDWTQVFHRHCPDVHIVNSVLCGEESITDNDVICLACYKRQLTICKSNCNPENGSKGQLETFISIWEHDPDTDKLTRCILHVALHLAKTIFENQAILLPTLSRMFVSMYMDNSPGECIVDTEEGSVKFSSKWLLKQFLVYFPHHLDFKCVHRRYGTVLYTQKTGIC